MNLTNCFNIRREDSRHKMRSTLMINGRLNFSFGQLCLADKLVDDSTVGRVSTELKMLSCCEILPLSKSSHTQRHKCPQDKRVSFCAFLH